MDVIMDVGSETLMDVLEEVQRTGGNETLGRNQEVQPLWTYLRKCNPYGRT